MPECTHRMSMTYDQSEDIGAGWIGTGYRCRRCGFQTCITSTYIPINKVCHCGNSFEGRPDVDDEICNECFQRNLDEWGKQVKACPHKNLRRGLCRDCGTGTWGKHQWRWQLLRRIHDIRYRLGIG